MIMTADLSALFKGCLPSKDACLPDSTAFLHSPLLSSPPLMHYRYSRNYNPLSQKINVATNTRQV